MLDLYWIQNAPYIKYSNLKICEISNKILRLILYSVKFQ
jgi:hypothetical protein